MHCFFAHIVDDKVVDVIVVPREATWDSNGIEDESVGSAYCQQFKTGLWVQTFPDARKRKWFAGVGFSWRGDLDGFVPPKPNTECTLDEERCHWIAPDGTNLSIPSAPRSMP
jgi:hypothetical protein